MIGQHNFYCSDLTIIWLPKDKNVLKGMSLPTPNWGQYSATVTRPPGIGSENNGPKQTTNQQWPQAKPKNNRTAFSRDPTTL